MTEEQMIGDAAHQIVRSAKTTQQVAGKDEQWLKDHIVVYAQVQNRHGWGYGLPESAGRPEVVQSYHLDDQALPMALDLARTELGI